MVKEKNGKWKQILKVRKTVSMRSISTMLEMNHPSTPDGQMARGIEDSIG
jgi:hypothetical protein